jgi:hypothetical protein
VERWVIPDGCTASIPHPHRHMRNMPSTPDTPEASRRHTRFTGRIVTDIPRRRRYAGCAPGITCISLVMPMAMSGMGVSGFSIVPTPGPARLAFHRWQTPMPSTIAAAAPARYRLDSSQPDWRGEWPWLRPLRGFPASCAPRRRRRVGDVQVRQGTSPGVSRLSTVEATARTLGSPTTSEPYPPVPLSNGGDPWRLPGRRQAPDTQHRLTYCFACSVMVRLSLVLALGIHEKRWHRLHPTR